MTFDNFIHLGPVEIVPDRPFTNPQHSQTDLGTLGRMFTRLMEVVRTRHQHSCDEHYQVIRVQEDGGRQHRIIVKDGQSLVTARELAVVGFCGQRRPELHPRLLQEMEVVDQELVTEMVAHPHLVSYSSLELSDGNWTNLVLMRSVEGIAHWRASQRHAAAASDLSPQYYRSIRLHNAMLTVGPDAPHLILLRTKYYDFRDAPPWMAIRELSFSSDSQPGLLG
jgi:hypothetical protein